MNPFQQGLDFLTELGNVGLESTSRWLEQQRAAADAVGALYHTRFAALQNARQLADWAAAERAFVAGLNEQALDQLKSNIEFAQQHLSRLARLIGDAADATGVAAR